MSYTVEIPVTDLGWESQANALSVTTFAGGKRGRMVQITTDRDYVTLTREQVDDLIEVLTFTREHSLFDHPRSS